MSQTSPLKQPAVDESIGAFDVYTNDINAQSSSMYPGSEPIYPAATGAGNNGQQRHAWDTPLQQEPERSGSPIAWAAPSGKPAEPLAFTESTANPHSPPGRSSGVAVPAVPGPSAAGASAPWYTLRAYSVYFDVDTKEVGQRMLASLLFSRNFFLEVEAKPDLYGPFWLATTCIFLMAMVAAELSWLHHPQSAPETWSFDATNVGTCAGIFYGYVFVVGGLLWFHLAIINRAQIGLFSLWCIYGYSMTIWIPVTILSTIPLASLSWLFVSIATVYSATFLVLNLRQPVQESLSTSASQGVTLLVVFLMHLLSGLLLKLFVFHYSFDGTESLSSPPPSPALLAPPPA